MLNQNTANGGAIHPLDGDVMQLQIPAGGADDYKLAQLDDYLLLPRNKFKWQGSYQMSVEACASANRLPGTWGFGFWNDPFSYGLGAGGMRRVLPVLPNAAWFFYASEKNGLNLTPQQPGNGLLAAVYSAPLIPSCFSLFAAPCLPLLLWRATRRMLQPVITKLVAYQAINLDVDATQWVKYHLVVNHAGVVFQVNDEIVFSTPIKPLGRLGFVLWIDNQYAAFTLAQGLRWGVEPCAKNSNLSIKNLSISFG